MAEPFRDREKSLPCTDALPYNQGWARSKLGAWDLLQVSHLGRRGLLYSEALPGISVGSWIRGGAPST